MGFSPVATLADEQSLTVRSKGQIAVQFSPYFKSHFKNQKGSPSAFGLPLKWSWKWDLNPRPIDYESIALPLRHSSNYLDILSFFALFVNRIR